MKKCFMCIHQKECSAKLNLEFVTACNRYEARSPTNRDKVNVMNNSALARLFAKGCPAGVECIRLGDGTLNCHKCWKLWLDAVAK